MARERTWLSIGKDLVERLTQRSVENKIKNMRWRRIPTDGSEMSLGFSPGMAIQAAIKEFGLPKVSAIAISSFHRPEYHPSFYGIEANYKNGKARLYLLDDGVTLTPLASDFWPLAAQVEATSERVGEWQTAAYEAAVYALACNVYRAYSNLLLGAPSPAREAEFNRVHNPVPGDLVLELSFATRSRMAGVWPGQSIGILREIILTPAYTPEQWEQVCASESERYEWLKTDEGSGDAWLDEWLLKRGPRKPTDPIPLEKEYVIEPFLGENDTVRWYNADFIAGSLTASSLSKGPL